MPRPNWREESVSVAGLDVHFYRGGEGPPLVLLHGGDPNPGWLQHHQGLAEQFSVYAPSHPGFGHTPGLAWTATIADMALFYLWFLETVGLEWTHLADHDIDGWLAADMATACPHVVDRLVLVDAMGLKPQHSEIRDIFLITPDEVRARSFFDTTQVPEWQQLYGQPPTPEAADRFGYLLCCYVVDNEAKAQEETKHFIWRMGETTRGPREYFAPPGYRSHIASQIAARRRISESKPLGQQNIEELQATYHVVAGTPDTVLKKLRFLKDELNIGHLVFYGQESRMSHEATIRSIELFGKEVMPAICEW